MSRNNVRGPTSALTEFLRESGITPTTVARRAATAQQPVAGPSNLRSAEQSHDDGGNRDGSRRRQRVSRSSAYDSDHLDGSDEEKLSKSKLSKAAQKKIKENAKKKQKRDADGSEDEGDTYNALSRSLRSANGSSAPTPPVGGFEICAKCEKQFTVTKYTLAANPPPGYLCHQCAKASGVDPFKKKPAPPKKREKRTLVSHEDRPFPSLASMCIQIISRYIDDVEALGEIGTVNLDEISKAISKNRSLTPQNAPLFYGAQNTTLILYDVTLLPSDALSTLAHLNPNLTHLRLDFCGHMDDAVIKIWCTSLPSLKRLELLGPYLVRVPGWKSFFESHPQLEGFLITQSPRFDVECMESLAINCPHLKELRLKEIGKMEEAFLGHLKTFTGLSSLDLSEPGTSLSEEGLAELVMASSSNLTTLDFSCHDSITDWFLDFGVKPHACILTSLSLRLVPLLTDEGVAKFFNTWASSRPDPVPNPPLISLDLSRNEALSGAALSALLSHSGSALQNLNINGWKATSVDALNEIAQRARDLRALDVGFCREVDNFVLGAVMQKCEKIKEIKCWGCNRVTETCPRKRNVRIFGIESHSVL